MTIDDLLADHDQQVQATARWLRACILDAVPDMTERVWPGWHGLGYRHPDAGHVCGVFPRRDDVMLVFEYGVHLPDPDGVLDGDGSLTRHVLLTRPEDVAPHLVIALLDAAIEFRSNQSGCEDRTGAGLPVRPLEPIATRLSSPLRVAGSASADARFCA